jgi:hypothetical protein
MQEYSVDLFLQYPEVKVDLAKCDQQGQLVSDEGLCQALEAGTYSKAITVSMI